MTRFLFKTFLSAGLLLGVGSYAFAVDPPPSFRVTQVTSPWVTSASQSGTWTTGRTWTLLNSTDSVNAVQSGTWAVNASQSGTWSLRLQDGSGNLVTSQANGSQRALDVGIDVAGVQVDPRARTWTLSNGTDSIAAVQSGTWTVQQGGTPTSVGNAWPFKLTDGTNTTAVKAASTAPVATDPAAVVVQSPNGNHATSALQTTLNTSINSVIGSKAPGTAATNSQLVGGVYNSTAPVLTTSQQASLQLNSSGALIVDGSTASGVAMINRTDASTTVSASGNTATLDTAGLSSLNMNFNVTAISGTGAYIQFHTQTSDDGTNWTTYADTARLTATGLARYQAFRQAGRYYRYSWDVAGTTPSATFNIVSTLKTGAQLRKSVRFFYSDLDLQTNGNVSSAFSSDDCHNVAVAFIRGADGGNNGTVQIESSLDGTNWFSQTGNLAANPGTSNSSSFFDSAFRFYHLVVQAHTSVGTRVLDIQWSCD